MADNVPVTPGIGADIATDDVAGVHYQRVKLNGGSDGASTPILAGGGVEADSLRVTIANDSTGLVSVDDNGGSLTIDAPVGTPAFVRLSDGAAAITTLPVSLAAAATAIGKALDAASLTGDVGVPAMARQSFTPMNQAGSDGDYEFLQMSAGRLWTSGVVTAAATSIGKAEDSASADADVGVPAMAIQQSSPADTAGTNGDYAMLQMSAGRLWTSSQVYGAVAHDSADSGNPIKTGSRAVSSLATATLVAAADRADGVSDLDGAVIQRPLCPLGDVIVERVSNTNGTSTAFSNFGAVASTRNYITTLTVYNDSATSGYLDIRDGTAGTVLFTLPLPAKGGGTVSFPVPLRQTTANTALAFDVSAALTTVYISAIGFQSKC